MKDIFALMLSYGLGCIITGYYLTRVVTGKDIRGIASGNAGSRNVGRILGAKGFIVTFIGDAGKGVVAVWLAQQIAAGQWLPYAALLCVSAGHIWPVQLGFRGGKGLATMTGGLAILNPPVFVCCLISSLVLLGIMRSFTMAGLITVAVSPGFLFVKSNWHAAAPAPAVLLYIALVGMVLFAHRANIYEKLHCSLSQGKDL
jgi:glycerol-3-phosphate acyltransferase PlsY